MSHIQGQKKSSGARKIGRSRRAKDMALSAYVRGKISFERYAKAKGIRTR